MLAPDFLPRTKFTIPPMGIASISAILRQNGYEVDQDDLDIKTRQKVIDLNIFHRSEEIEK